MHLKFTNRHTKNGFAVTLQISKAAFSAHFCDYLYKGKHFGRGLLRVFIINLSCLSFKQKRKIYLRQCFKAKCYLTSDSNFSFIREEVKVLRGY